MERSTEIGKLVEALSKAQGAMNHAEMDGKGNFGKYATLASLWQAARKPLTDNGLAVIQTTDVDPDGGLWLTTTLAHTSGEWIAGNLPVRPVQNTPQGVGSALTYARRYGLGAIAGMSADDDDDGKAGSDGKPNTPRQPTRTEAAERMAAAGRSVPPGVETKPTNATNPDAELDALGSEAQAVRVRRAFDTLRAKQPGQDWLADAPTLKKAKAYIAQLLPDRTQRHTVTAYLLDTDNYETWTQAQCLALIEWIGLAKVNDEWVPLDRAITGARMILALEQPSLEAAE